MYRSLRPLAAATLAAIAVAAVILTACGDGAGGDGSSVEVVATTTQIADLVRAVGGERISLTQILQPGSDPHGFEPQPSDVAATATARLVFSNGQDLDPWADQLVSGSGSEAELVDLSATLPDSLPGQAEPVGGDHDEHEDSQEHGDEHAHDTELDPHWWHDPRNALAAIKVIAAHLVEVDPEASTEYERNAKAYGQRLERLDRQIAACIDRIAPERRKLVTDHEAFGNFAHRYGLEVVGAVIPARTTQAQPSARDLRELAAEIKEQGVDAIFPEASLSPKLAQTIADQTGASADHTLYGDALGPAGSDGATYLEMMAANARAVVDGLSAGEVRCELDRGE